MDCNRDEAAKAKELAEKKLAEKDYNGARKFAMKANSLFSGLDDGVQSLLATLNIYISAERKINGEIDWYGVLGVDPSSDDETVKKRYRKLALTLHPDKNKSVGAEGAFKILSEAWSLLSDKTRRTAYDKKRNTRVIFEKVVPSHPSNPVDRDSLHRSTSNGSFEANKNAPNPHLVPPPLRNTFWTVCTSCKMQFEYVRHYLNKNLVCYNCKEPFLAIPITAPQTNAHPQVAAHAPQESSSYPSVSMSSPVDGKMFISKSASVPAGFSGNAGSGPAYSSGAQAMNGSQVPHDNSRGMHQNLHVSATLEDVIKSKSNAKRAYAGEANASCSVTKGEKPKRRRRTKLQMMMERGAEKIDGLSRGTEAFGLGSVSGVHRSADETEKVTTVGTKWPDSRRELSLLETRNMLMEKAKKEICMKLNEWKDMAAQPKASNKEVGSREKEKTKANLSVSQTVPNFGTNSVEIAGGKSVASAGAKCVNENLNTSSPTDPPVDCETQASENPILSMDVPDADFHDFDKDRTENSFGDNQVWAAYDNDDGMPRYYAMVHNVISRKPFKMRISWLNSKSTAEFGPLDWVGRGFYKTSGDFRVGKHELNKTVNSFSHRVNWTKGARGAIRIYPSKGDVWALYRNWSSDWDERTPDELIHQYDMVQVLTDYNDEKGVTVIPLVKVAGFKTVFQQHMDQEQVRIIPRQEIFRLSHQVPFCLVTGQESPSAPKGYLELDPAAIPTELLEVISEAREPVMKQNAEEIARDVVLNAKMTQVKEKIRSDIARSEAGMIEAGMRVQVGTATVGS